MPKMDKEGKRGVVRTKMGAPWSPRVRQRLKNSFLIIPSKKKAIKSEDQWESKIWANKFITKFGRWNLGVWD